MDQSLSAIVARGPADRLVAERLGLGLLSAGAFIIVPLACARIEALAEALEITDRALSEMPVDCALAQELAKALGFARYALIETALDAGSAPERATVYHGLLRTMPLRQGAAAVNDALERVGVRPEAGRDALTILGLAGLRRADFAA